MNLLARALRILTWSGLLLLAACSGSEPTQAPTEAPPSTQTLTTPTPEPSPSPQGPIQTVSIWLTWTADAIRQLNELVESYQADHPEVQFSVSYVPPTELRETLDAAFSAGTPPSVFLAPSTWGPELIQSGLIADLSQLPFEQVRSVVQPLAWSQVEYGTRVIGVPIQMHGNVLYRNRDLAPVPAATVESMVEAARGLRGTLEVGISLDYGFATSGPLSQACGGPLIQQGLPLDLEGAVVPCWLGLLQELAPAGPVDFNTDADRKLFVQAGSAWQIDSTELYDPFRSALGPELLVVDPWPVFENTGEPVAGYVWTENAYFSSGIGPNELQQAWAFISMLVSADSQLALSDPNRAAHIPVHAAVPPPTGVLGQMDQSLLGGVALPLWTIPADQVDVLERAARAVSLQGTDVETALRRAIEELAENG